MSEHDMYPNQLKKLSDVREQPERPHPKRAVVVVQQEEPKGMKKFIGLFFEEGAKDLGKYLLEDLIVPSIKDAVLNALNYAFWGSKNNSGTFRNGQRVNQNGNFAYNKISSAGKVQNITSSNQNENRTQSFDPSQVVFRTQAEATLIFDQLIEYLNQFPAVTVGYLKECLTDEEGNLQYQIYPTDEYIGWTNLNNVTPRRVSGGWIIPFPRPIRVNR